MKPRTILILTALSLTLFSAYGDPSNLGGNTVGTVQQQGSVIFTSSGGWLEAGFAEWRPLTSASGYGVYRKLAAEPDSAYVKVDPKLVRGTRVDIPSLA